MAQDRTQNFTVGVAVNCGPSSEKTELIDLLDRAFELSGKLGLYVEGRPFQATLSGVIGALQRSNKTEEPVAAS